MTIYLTVKDTEVTWFQALPLNFLEALRKMTKNLNYDNQSLGARFKTKTSRTVCESAAR
jgi:hypothetical protein